MQDLRSSLTLLAGQIEQTSRLTVIIDSIIGACRHYMNSTRSDVRFEEMNDRLFAVRKVIGINIAELCNFYHLDPGPDLAGTFPAGFEV
ncbi:hypothetical protein ACCP96_14225 [Xanthomonas campestris pv. fici]|uniref:hypothetical protein n=1 Tax=Xanthomonas euvesicatoria TaxID=456327 RepID=UPI003558B4E3